MTTIHDINVLAADALDEHGWTQGVMESGDGRMCLVGALRHCSPQPGDWLIARAVYRCLDHAEGWNDEEGRTQAEVTAWLRAHPVTDTDLEDTFGPQWQAIVALIRQAATLTPDQADAICVARDSIDGYWKFAVSVAAEVTTGVAAWFAAWDAAWDAAGVSAGKIAGETARALVVAHLVGQHGLTQDHIDTLMGPWVSVMGDPRDGVEVGS